MLHVHMLRGGLGCTKQKKEIHVPTIYPPAPPYPHPHTQTHPTCLAPLAAQLVVPAGVSNYTVYLRSYDSERNALSEQSARHAITSAAKIDPDNLCPDGVPLVRGKRRPHPVPGIIQVRPK